MMWYNVILSVLLGVFSLGNYDFVENYGAGRGPAESQWYKLGRPRLALEALDKDYVPIPWERIHYDPKDRCVRLWNRVYDFSGGEFLTEVKSGSFDLLASPAVIRIKFVEDKQKKDLIFSEPQVIQELTGGGRLVFTRKSNSPLVQIELTYTIEYDGLIWCELKFNSPKNIQQIEKLQLIIPIEKKVSQFIHYVGAPVKYTSQNLPQNSYSKSLPYTQGTHFQSGLKTMVWMGNTKAGLLWCTESDQGFWPKNRDDYIVAERFSDGRLLFMINMISEKLPDGVSDGIVYYFGLMATPVKPMPEGWRAWTFTTQWDSNKGLSRGTHLIYWPDEYRYMPLDQDPTRYTNVELLRRKVLRDVSEGRKIIPYWSRLNVGMEYEVEDPVTGRKERRRNPDANRMIREWGVVPNRSALVKKNSYYRLSATSGWSDYLVWCIDQFAERTGHIDGIYLDEVQPVPNLRAESGGGYVALDGSHRATYEFWGTRNLIKRISYNIYKRNKQRPCIVAHCSATQTVNSLSGCDVFVIGEHLNIGYLKDEPKLMPPKSNRREKLYYYSYVLPLDRMLAECFWRQWGQVIVWLPQFKSQDREIMRSPVATRDMLSRVMQADVLIWPLWCNRDEVLKTWKFRREFNIGDKDVDFVPFWENDKILPILESGKGGDKSKDVVVGYYHNKRKGTYLVIVSNLSRENKSVEIRFDGVKINSVKNAESLTEIPLDNGQWLSLDLNRNDYKALRINY